MLRVGVVGWRGMVGSVLVDRMVEERDLDGVDVRWFSTSGHAGPGGEPPEGAHDLRALQACDVLLVCQGSDYTLDVHPALRAAGWRGVWIDASSALRTAPTSRLVLDPINGAALREALVAGCVDFVGANCTVSLMLMGMVGLIRTGEVSWISSMTYQAASGAGAAAMLELVGQMGQLARAADGAMAAPARSALAVERAVRAETASLDATVLSAPLAGSLLPWIDRAMPNGQSREEWKAAVEAERLLGQPLPVDGVCVRVGALRCHAQGLTIALRRPLPAADVEAAIASAHPWVSVVPNTPEATLARLTPAAVAGTLGVPVGRLRPTVIRPDLWTAFTVGDQLLWGAAEPLRRMLRIVREFRE